MRILHVNKFAYRRGGAESYMLDLIELQQKAGHETAIFAMSHPRNDPSSYSELFPPYVEYEPLPNGLAAKARAGGLMIWNRSAARGIERVVEQFRPDVAHLHNVYHQLSPSVIRPLTRHGVPAVMTIHDYKPVCPRYDMLDHGRPCEACLPHSFHQAPLRRCKNDSIAASGLLAFELGVHRLFGAYSGVHTFLCPSEFLAGKMRQGAFYPERLCHVPNFASIPSAPPQHDGSGPFIFVGRLASPKGVDSLIDAVGLVSDAQLEILGDGPERHALEQRAADVAPSRVTFAGHVDRDAVARRMTQARAVVLTSRSYENQPMTLLEAMALGVPIVGTDIGGIPELIDHGHTGLLVPVDDPRSLAAALQTLQSDPVRAKALGAAGRERAIAVHSPTVHLERLDAIYAAARHATIGS